MIKVGQDGPNGWLVALGVTREDLTGLSERDEVVFFDGGEVGLAPGTFAVGIEGARAKLRKQLGKKLKTTWELSQADREALLAGGQLRRSLESLGYTRTGDATLFLVAGEDLANLRRTEITDEAAP